MSFTELSWRRRRRPVLQPQTPRRRQPQLPQCFCPCSAPRTFYQYSRWSGSMHTCKGADRILYELLLWCTCECASFFNVFLSPGSPVWYVHISNNSVQFWMYEDEIMKFQDWENIVCQRFVARDDRYHCHVWGFKRDVSQTLFWAAILLLSQACWLDQVIWQSNWRCLLNLFVCVSLFACVILSCNALSSLQNSWECF